MTGLMPTYTFEIHPDDSHNPRDCFTYSPDPNHQRMIRDENGSWVKVSAGRYQMIERVGLQEGENKTGSFDTVQRPAHYNQSDIECIDAIKASMTLAEFQGFLKGNVQKYLWRASHKGRLEDLRKAKYYLDKLIGSHDGH